MGRNFFLSIETTKCLSVGRKYISMYNSIFSFKVSKILNILAISFSKEDTLPHNQCKIIGCLLFSGFPVCFLLFQKTVIYQRFFSSLCWPYLVVDQNCSPVSIMRVLASSFQRCCLSQCPQSHRGNLKRSLVECESCKL